MIIITIITEINIKKVMMMEVVTLHTHTIGSITRRRTKKEEGDDFFYSPLHLYKRAQQHNYFLIHFTTKTTVLLPVIMKFAQFLYLKDNLTIQILNRKYNVNIFIHKYNYILL